MSSRTARLTASTGLAVGLISGLLPGPTALAATFTPTRFDDPAPNGCNPGDCSLREAIIAANASAGPDTVMLAAGTYTLSIVGTDEDAAADGDLDITDDLTIAGQGAAATLVNGNGGATGERVFDLDPLATGTNGTVSLLGVRGGTGGIGSGILVRNMGELTLSSATVTENGTDAFSFGGGLQNQNSGTVLIEDSTISGNVVDNFAAGIMNRDDGTMTIRRSTVSGNESADGIAGGIFNQNDAVLTVENSVVTGNLADASGAGMYLQNQSNTTIANTTVSGNQSGNNGGGIFVGNEATATITNVTVTHNGADTDGDDTGDGGGVFINPSSTPVLNVGNSLIAGNTDGSAPGTVHPDCSGTLTSQGYNLIEDTAGCSIAGATTGNITGQDPKLGPLADNGGPTMTHALLTGSPAIDAAGPGAPPTDQRGVPRNPDIGAYELAFCQNVVVNQVGTEGDDTLIGTSGSDGFLALGGNDVASGLGGKGRLLLGPGQGHRLGRRGQGPAEGPGRQGHAEGRPRQGQAQRRAGERRPERRPRQGHLQRRPGERQGPQVREGAEGPLGGRPLLSFRAGTACGPSASITGDAYRVARRDRREGGGAEAPRLFRLRADAND